VKTQVRRQFALFVCIGLGATAVHVVIAAHLIGTHMVPPTLGNAIAFVFAHLFSYFPRAPTYSDGRRPLSSIGAS
jgi:putative flippase GtrA